MKKLLLFILLVVPSLALSQGLVATLKFEESYDGTTLDTVTISRMENYQNLFLLLSATDSISMVAKVVGTDLTNYATAVTVDSLVTTAAGMSSIDLSSDLAGYERALLILDCSHFVGAQSANSGATYTARLVGKR